MTGKDQAVSASTGLVVQERGNAPQRRVILVVTVVIVVVLLLNALWLERAYRWSPALFWLLDTGQFGVLPLIGFGLLWFYGVRPRDYGFRSLAGELSPVAQFGLLGFITFLYWLSYSVVSDIAQRYLGQFTGSFGYQDALPAWAPFRLIVVIYLSATAAFVEEAVFRSLPWLYFSLRSPAERFVGRYVIVTSLLFAAIHWEQGPADVIATFSLGLVAAYMYSRLNNIWPFVGAHFLIDVAAFGFAKAPVPLS